MILMMKPTFSDFIETSLSIILRRLQWTAVRKLNLTGLAPYTQIFYDMFIFARYFMTYLYLPDILWHIYICQIFYDMLIFARYFMIFLYLPDISWYFYICQKRFSPFQNICQEIKEKGSKCCHHLIPEISAHNLFFKLLLELSMDILELAELGFRVLSCNHGGLNLFFKAPQLHKYDVLGSLRPFGPLEPCMTLSFVPIMLCFGLKYIIYAVVCWIFFLFNRKQKFLKRTFTVY